MADGAPCEAVTYVLLALASKVGLIRKAGFLRAGRHHLAPKQKAISPAAHNFKNLSRGCPGVRSNSPASDDLIHFVTNRHTCVFGPGHDNPIVDD